VSLETRQFNRLRRRAARIDSQMRDAVQDDLKRQMSDELKKLEAKISARAQELQLPPEAADHLNPQGEIAAARAGGAPVSEEPRIKQGVAKTGQRAGREQRARDRQARRNKKKSRWSPPLHEFPANEDPLLWTDRYKNPIGHALRDLWRPNAGFLLGGGPSLRELDLSFLRQRGIVSLGINNVAGYAPVRAMTFSDPPEKFCHAVFFDPAIMKLCPVPKLGKRVRAKKPDGTFGFTSVRVMDCPNVWGYQRNSIWDAKTFLSSEIATWGRSKGSTIDPAKGQEKILFTFFLGLRLMHYLGCRQVFLLGADFTMSQSDGTGPGYAFAQGRTKGAAGGNNNHYRKAQQMCLELLPTFAQHGFEVFNCNPDSHLTAFPYYPLDQAIELARGLVPPEPFPPELLSNWYEKENDPDEKKRGTDA